MEKISNFIFSKIFVTLILGIASFNAYGQVVIGQPNLGFTKACASDSFNIFEADFVFNPEDALESTNQFIVELSDETGSFENATIVFTSEEGEITTSPATIAFSLPVTAGGENYRVRIKSTAPAATSAPSVSFPAYYKVHDTPFTINGLMDTATYCPGTGYLLTIDNPAVDGSVSPLSYDNLSFNWFRVVDGTNSTWVGEGNTFEVTEEGIYFAATAYGSCSSESFSNRVTVSQATSDEPANAAISSSLGNTFCSDGQGTILTTISGDRHEWFRNDQPITGATGNTLQTNESGDYAVIVYIGDCVAVGSISLVSLGQSTSLNVPAVNFIEMGETIEATVETSLEGAWFEWYLNDEIIAGASGSSITVSQPGLYKVIMTATGSCDFTTELSFELRVAVDVENIPNIVSPNGDGLNDTWMIPADYLSGTDTEVIIISSSGNMVLKTRNYNNDWPLNTTTSLNTNQIFYYMIAPPSGEAIKGSITVLK